MHHLVWSCVHTTLTSVLLLLLTSIGMAQVMSSTNYQIQSDSINTAGGYASSTNYALETTVGERASGFSTSTSFSLGAGFQQMQVVYLSMSPADPVDMTPSIPGVTGGTAIGSTSLTVTTDNLAGYELTIEAEGSPAMTSGGNVIADYAPVGGAADFTFDTGAADAHLGFSPEGSDVVSRYLDAGSSCGSGSDSSDRCWDGLSTSPRTIASDSSSNHPFGTETTVKFQVGVGGSVAQAPGTYIATTTLTALPL